jgi:hypothetical protein
MLGAPVGRKVIARLHVAAVALARLGIYGRLAAFLCAVSFYQDVATASHETLASSFID